MSDPSVVQVTQSPEEMVAQFRTDCAVALAESKGVIDQLRAQLAQASTATTEAEQSQKQAAANLIESAQTLMQAKKLAVDAAAVAERLVASEAKVAEQSATVTENKEQALKSKNEVDVLLAKVTTLTTEAEALKEKIAVSAGNVDDLLTKTQTAGKTSEDASLEIKLSNAAAKKSEDALAGMAGKAATAEDRVSAYESRLALLETQADAHLKTIVGLLPGATSAGLASAFDKRGLTFKEPGKLWQIAFITSVIVLILLACSGLWHVYHSANPLTYDELFRLWLARLPIAGALVWLALHAGRESALAKRLEEDYGYKSAVAASFLGFNEQMSKLTELAAPNSPISKLCSDTLATIANPPGRIYDKHKLTISPTDEVTAVISKLAGNGAGH